MKLLLVSLAFLPCVVFGTSGPGSVPEPTAELKVMTERLHLSQGQQHEIAPILVAESKKRKAIEANTTLSTQQKHDQTGTVHRAALKQIKTYFTAAQIALIEQGQNNPQQSSTRTTSGN